MPNGKPGDHPLTDIILHNYSTYGSEIDSLIKEIYKISQFRDLDGINWFENQNRDELKSRLQDIYDRLTRGKS